IQCSGRPSGEGLGRFFRVRFPRTVRRHAGFVAAAVLVLALGILTGWRLTLEEPERFYSFVDDSIAQGRTPSSSTEELRDALYKTGDPPGDPEDSGDDPYGLGAFASFPFTHNAQVGLLSFALGFAAGVPVLFLLFSNGLVVGAFAALYQSRGLGFELWAWLLPHGVSELAAVCLCGAAGLIVGASLVFPGPHSRLQNLAIQGRSAALLVLGAMFMLLLAGALEGAFRQAVHDPAVRLAVAAVTFLGWLLYFLLAGRHADDPPS
ncbi:MAG: stage II sporulation protein M, partial [Acidobacteriota bacterium]